MALPSEPTSPPKKLLLIIEDHEQSRMYLHKVLEEKYEVVEAWALNTGIRQVESKSPDLILLDLNLKDSRGLETLKRFVSYLKNPKPIIIVITGESLNGSDVIKSGADGYVEKPVEPRILITRIEEELARRETAVKFHNPMQEKLDLVQSTLNKVPGTEVMETYVPSSTVSNKE